MPAFFKDGEILTKKRKGTFYSDVIALIPAYNAEKTIGNVVRKTLRKVGRCIVINDGSDDGTGNAAVDAGAELIIHVSNCGKGAAIRTGLNCLRKISYKYVVLLDADGQHEPGEIARMVQVAYRRRAHLVCGNRMSKPEGMPLICRVTNRVMSKVVSKLSGVNLSDTQCGYRLLSRRAIESLRLTKSDFEVDTEILYQVSRKGFKVTEVTISSIYTENHSSKVHVFSDTFRFIRLVFGLLISKSKSMKKPEVKNRNLKGRNNTALKGTPPS